MKELTKMTYKAIIGTGTIKPLILCRVLTGVKYKNPLTSHIYDKQLFPNRENTKPRTQITEKGYHYTLFRYSLSEKVTSIQLLSDSNHSPIVDHGITKRKRQRRINALWHNIRLPTKAKQMDIICDTENSCGA